MIVGMDVHRNRTQVCVVDGEGKGAIWPRRGWHPRGSRAAPVAGGAGLAGAASRRGQEPHPSPAGRRGHPSRGGVHGPGPARVGELGSVHHAHHRCVVSALIGGGRDSYP